MPDAWLRKLMLVAVTLAVVAALVRVLRGDPAPQFAGHGLVPDPAAAPASATNIVISWAEPVDGACPLGFPVKAKLTSGIFHVPGGLSYERANPDRCYSTPEAAAAEGLRAAKR